MTKLAQVCEAIVARIEAGELRDGDRLPSEEQLASGFSVALSTVQRALARLAQDGVVSREHGRGTFVSGTRVGPAGVNFLRFRDRRGRDLPDYIRVLRVQRDRRKGPWREFLETQDACVRIERMISVDGRFDLYGEFWLQESDFAAFDGVAQRSLASNLRVLLGQRLSLPTLRVEQTISFSPPPVRIARQLGVPVDAPAFRMDMCGHTLRDRPLFFQRIHAGPFADDLVILR